MSLVINTPPELRYRPVWLTGEIDFPVEMTHGHLVQTSTGVRGGSAKQFDYELKWGCERFKQWREREGEYYIELPTASAVQAKAQGFAVAHGFIIDGPFLPMKFASKQDDWPRVGDDNEVVSRRRETSLAETGGKVCYRMAGLFLIKEHVMTREVSRDKEPELYAAVRNAKKTEGLWTPQFTGRN